MSTPMKRLSETEIREGTGQGEDSCCGSCHTDQEFGYEMCEVESPEHDLWASVCCGTQDPTPEQWAAIRSQA